MTGRERVLQRERDRGRRDALALQQESKAMTGTELNAAEDRIPEFSAAVKQKNMLHRTAGFVCRSPEGRVVRLLQSYDSDSYPQVPEELAAQWGFVWSRDPEKAKPFLPLATSPYGKGDCCRENGVVYRSLLDGNVWSPAAYREGWEKV